MSNEQKVLTTNELRTCLGSAQRLERFFYVELSKIAILATEFTMTEVIRECEDLASIFATVMADTTHEQYPQESQEGSVLVPTQWGVK